MNNLGFVMVFLPDNKTLSFIWESDDFGIKHPIIIPLAERQM